MIPSQRQSSTALRPAAQDSDSTSVRSRNRRIVNSSGQDAGSSLSTPNRSPSRGASPIPAARIGGVTGRNNTRREYAPPPARGKNSTSGRGLIDSSWAPSWASVQGFATSILSGSSSLFTQELEGAQSRDASRTQGTGAQNSYRDNPKHIDNWGPEPPSESTPRLGDVGAGSRTQRDARLKAMRTASVLESHDGVNGGLDVSGGFKKRRSDEDLRSSSQSQEEEGDHLVYIHHVQPVDTYAGIVLKYRCREDAFRKANGLWSRDNIQTRKCLVIPVDACEVRGRPYEGPAFPSAQVDLLAQTPDVTDQLSRSGQTTRDDFFSPSTTTNQSDHPKTVDEQPWTHVRWVSLDSFPSPVEIGRVPRKALGYFPPRRKKSLVSGSLSSTPRGSIEVPSITLSPDAALESPRTTSSRRPSLLSSRPQLSGTHTQGSGRSRVGSAGEDARPAWMRRPGGVGSLGRSVRTPGPAKDYFNTWTRKHLPGLNIDSMPSMSVMGAETARFGFGGTAEEHATIAESPFEEGRDTSALGNQSTGLDKAALTVETWLRSAFAKHPGTPILGPRGRSGAMEEGDLIELTDTNSDDGRGRTPGGPGEEFGLLGSAAFGSSGWSTADGREAVRGRNGGGNVGKANKSD